MQSCVTPNGIFFDSDTIAEISQEPNFFLMYLDDENEQFIFLAIAAHIEMFTCGYPNIAKMIWEHAQKTKPDADWGKIEQIIKRVCVIFDQQPEGWQEAIRNVLENDLLPAKYHVPDSYQSRFFDCDTVIDIFAHRGSMIDHIFDEHNENINFALLILTDLELNIETALAAEIKAKIIELWPEFDDWDNYYRNLKVFQKIVPLSVKKMAAA